MSEAMDGKGVARTLQPAARPAVTPEDESSKTTQSRGAKPKQSRRPGTAPDSACPLSRNLVVMCRGTGIPLAARRRRASRFCGAGDYGSIRFGGSAASRLSTPGSTPALPVREFNLLNKL